MVSQRNRDRVVSDLQGGELKVGFNWLWRRPRDTAAAQSAVQLFALTVFVHYIMQLGLYNCGFD